MKLRLSTYKLGSILTDNGYYKLGSILTDNGYIESKISLYIIRNVYSRSLTFIIAGNIKMMKASY